MAQLASEVFQCYLALNYWQHGISESYWLKANNWNDAKRDSLEIAKLRSWLLGEGAEICWCDVRQPVYPAPMLPCLQDPIPALKRSNGTGYWLAPHDAASGLNVIWKPQGRKSYWKRLWYLADSDFFNGEWIRAGLTIPKVTPARPRYPATVRPEVFYQYVLARIRDLTCLSRQFDDLPDGSHQFELTPFERVTFGDIGSSQPRPRWDRVSWESHDWEYAPHFSPCGCVVGVRRSLYAASCRFYTNGLSKSLRYYYARSGARILSFATIFHPWYGLVDIVNPGGPGEATGVPIIPWVPGYAWGAAPGIAPTGGPNAFLGKAAKPFDGSLPTPLHHRPQCDMPVPYPLRVEDDELEYIEPDTRRLTFEYDDFVVSELEDANPLVALRNPFNFTFTVSSNAHTFTKIKKSVLNSKDGFYIEKPTNGTVFIGKDSFWPDALVIEADLTDYPPGETNQLLLGEPGGFDVTGFSHGTPGRRLTLRNVAPSENFVIRHMDGRSQAENRIHVPGGGDYVLQPNRHVDLVYDAGQEFWLLDPAFVIDPREPQADKTYSLTRFSAFGDNDGFVLGASRLEETEKALHYDGAIIQAPRTWSGREPLLDPDYGASIFAAGPWNQNIWSIVNEGPGRILHIINTKENRVILVGHNNDGFPANQRIHLLFETHVILFPGESMTLIAAPGDGGWYCLSDFQYQSANSWHVENLDDQIGRFNTTFTVENYYPGYPILCLGGLLLTEGADYAWNFAEKTFVFHPQLIPQPGDHVDLVYLQNCIDGLRKKAGH